MISYNDLGKGEAIVLLHGFLESKKIWEPFAAELSKKFRVITIDLPGFGESECLAETHTMDLMAEAIYDVLHFLEVKKCVMIGHSMGGYVTLAFAENHPGMLKGFGLFHSQAMADPPEVKKNRTRAIEVVRKDHLGFIIEFIPSLFNPDEVKKYRKEIKALQEDAKRCSTEAVIAAIRGMRERPSRVHVLEKTKLPVLFILGKKDQKINFEQAMMQASVPKQSHCLLLGNVAHMGYIEASDVTLKAIVHFAESVF